MKKNWVKIITLTLSGKQMDFVMRLVACTIILNDEVHFPDLKKLAPIISRFNLKFNGKILTIKAKFTI